MKLEKINDNQFRCILSKEDLEDRDLHLSELTYGSTKAKSLFDDLIGQAHKELGFIPDDAPLMVEAIPASTDTIILTVTKVSDPSELDTRFSQFAPDNLSGQNQGNESANQKNKIRNFIEKMAGSSDESNEKKLENTKNPNVRIFFFSSLDCAIEASKVIDSSYNGASALYLDESTNELFMALSKHNLDQDTFEKISNALTEYASPVNAHSAALAYLNEHARLLIDKDAIKVLSTF